MEELFQLLIVFFILAPFLEKLLKGMKKGDEPPLPKERPGRPSRAERGEIEPPDRWHGEESPVALEEEPGRTRWTTVKDEEATSAADMVPDDLWEVLTGQKRQAPSGPTSPVPERPVEPRGWTDAPVDETEGEVLDDEYAWSYEERARLDERALEAAAAGEEAYSLETTAEPDYPRVVSLETAPLPEAQRHRQFHERVDALPSAATVARGTRHPLLAALNTPASARQAVVLGEVLGQPKGLE